MKSNFIPKLSIVSVENLRLRAYIGFVDWEKEKLQDVIVSFSFKYNTRQAAATDDVAFAVNYKNITKHLIQLIDNKSFHLIEHLAEKVYDFIVGFNPEIQDVDVKIEKPHALRFADNVLVKISSADRYNTAVISLGSNINSTENFNNAIKHLQCLGFIIQRTEFIETKPLKFEDQANFLNGAILLVTKKSLAELEMELKQIEAIMGRVRSENKNAPREIDLDITTFNGFLIDKEINELPFLIDFVKYLQPELTLS